MGSFVVVHLEYMNRKLLPFIVCVCPSLSGRGRGRKRTRTHSTTSPTETPPKLQMSARNSAVKETPTITTVHGMRCLSGGCIN